MNHLIHETSPYLLQHAHNPVNWYAWKTEAFELAKRENKPILVSIGYSTCHWCHVMERDAFEVKEVADLMNEYFVCIKVDREERPDVDQIYMEACQILSGSGGWPLNCFLLPDGRPFFAGTYFPPESSYNRPSWTNVLMNISSAYKNNYKIVEEQAQRLVESIQQSDNAILTAKNKYFNENSSYDLDEVLGQIFNNLQEKFDRKEGGFGSAPKFPSSMAIQFLMHYYYFTKNEDALNHAIFSLEKMIHGGIYDQIGGGFARYSTDRAWFVPHFEKMLYDNALLVSTLSEAYKITKKTIFKETIEETLDYIEREMTNEEGGFFCALDADSEGVEGKFYVWKKSEIEQILGNEAALFCDFYDIKEGGNWEENNILWRDFSYETYALRMNIDLELLKEKLKNGRKKIFSERKKRIYPSLDDKSLLGWNALMCTAYANAYQALGNENYKQIAIKNMDFLLKKFKKENDINIFYHTYKDGKAQYEAFLEDYAFLIEALMEVYQISFDTKYLDLAKDLTDDVINYFWDKVASLFYFTSEKQSDIVVRKKDLYDSATPSGNSTMLLNLQKLAILFDENGYKLLVDSMLKCTQNAIVAYPNSFARWGVGLMNEVKGWQEIAVVGDNATNLAKALQQKFIPNKILMASVSKNEKYPLLLNRYDNEFGKTLIYVCQNYACQRPINTIKEFELLNY